MTESPTNPAPDVTSDPSTNPTEVTTVTAHFKLVFICVMAMTVLTLSASLYIAIFVEKPTESAKSAMDTCSNLASLGFGAMVGLLGGKAVQ